LHVPCSTLEDARVLVVEDEYFVAEEITRALEDRGAKVIGPAPTMADALTLISDGPLDAAILDINPALRDDMSGGG